MSVGLTSPKRDTTAISTVLASFTPFSSRGEYYLPAYMDLTHKFSVFWAEFDDLHASSWAPRRLQIVHNFLNIYMPDNVQKKQL